MGQLIQWAYDAVARAAPDGLKRNTILRRMGQLSTELGEYKDIQAKPRMSLKAQQALARAESEGKLWVRKDCGCK